MKVRPKTLFVQVWLLGGCSSDPIEGSASATEAASTSTTTASTASPVPTTGDEVPTSTSAPSSGVTEGGSADTSGGEPSTTGSTTAVSTTSTSSTSTETTTAETSSTTEPSSSSSDGSSSSGVAPVCGDGVQDAGEACDDGNSEPSDACTDTCALAVCGDGVVQAGVDACDDANSTNNDACSNKCVVTPTTVTLGPGMNTTQAGNLNGGTAYNEPCPDGRALIGFAGSYNVYHRQIHGVCGLIGLTPAMDGFAVTLSDPVDLPEHGAFGNTPWMRTCPQGQVIVGFSGRSGGLVDSLTFACAPLVVGEAVDGTWSIAVGAATDLAPVGGNGGNPFAKISCPMGQIATMQRLRSGDGLDAFGLGCSAVGLAF